MISNRIVQKNNVAGGVTTNLWGWGKNTGEIIKAYGSSSWSSPVMTDKDGSTSNWSVVSNGEDFVCAIDNNNKLYCWGKNTFGQLGIGNTTNTTNPTYVGGSFRQVSCGTNHVLALKQNGDLYSWGRNNKGQVGDGTNNDKSTPVKIGSSTWIMVSAGDLFSAAITYQTQYQGDLFTWGYNINGQLGLGNTFDQNTPQKVLYGSYPTYMWSNVSAGRRHCLALSQNYLSTYFLSWGRNSSYQLGNGNTTSYSSPIKVANPANANIRKIEAGGDTSAFIDVNNSTYLWGDNTYGQVGNNNTTNQPTPQGLGNGYSEYIEMVARTSSKVTTFLKTNNGKIYSWGYAANGILGDGTTTNKSSPVQVGSATDWASLSKTGGIGSTTMFALKA